MNPHHQQSVLCRRLAAGSLLLALATAVGCHPAAPKASPASPQSDKPAAVLPADIDRLLGPAWHGSLTYLDYTSRKPTQIPSALLVTRTSASPPSWSFAVSYDDEPHANSADAFAMSADGRELDGERVLERVVEADGSVRIVSETDGQDDHQPARLRHVLKIADHACSRQKLVRLAGQAEFFERHIYRWSR